MFDCYEVNDTTTYYKELVPKEDWPDSFIVQTPVPCQYFRSQIPPTDPSYRYTVVVLYVVIMVTSLIGNTLVIYTVLFDRTMRTVTNMFLVSLSVSDLLITLLSVPYHILWAINSFEWEYGDVLCKLPQYIKGLSVTASVLSLTAISAERYLAILRPLAAQRYLSRPRLTVAVTLIWAVACLVYIPMLLYLGVRTTVEEKSAGDPNCTHEHCDYFNFTIKFSFLRCEEEWASPEAERAYTLCLFLMLFCLPVVIMGVLYGRVAVHLWFWKPAGDHSSARLRNVNTKRVVRVLILFIFVFVICWAPYFVSMLLRLSYKLEGDAYGAYAHRIFTLIAHANSAVNPFLYALMSQRFRERLSCCRKGKANIASGLKAANIKPLETVTKRTRASTFGESQQVVAPLHVEIQLN
ncbi:QRFP-like peptide receptor [Branchiostoma floridae]|uniref:QRFP-like peptide receptor n=1 Tax=Branchiostoma floridae TaxID=7739 RepID=A0A9J7HMD9_BRAFL|nr:QRFP-like peptide receptor [Branchiostoma floridae]